jgi:cytochrome c oxidase subunit 6b
MTKWETVYPKGISQCLREYFYRNSWIDSYPLEYDPRFPNTNQAKNCFVNFVDYQRCIKAKGEDASECDHFKNVYKRICPTEWVEHFNEQLENDAFPVVGLP